VKTSPTVAEFARTGAFVAVVAVGALTTTWLGLTDLTGSAAYAVGAAILLAIGLFASTSGISLDDARADLRIVVLAVTVGVVAKTAIIAGIMWAVFRTPEMALLGVVVAQIDPLSVAAIRERSHLSPRAQTILAAWSSFDDPITALLTVYLSAWLITGGASGPLAVSGTGSVLLQLALNLGLALAAYGLWKATGGAQTAARNRRVRLAAQRVLLAGVVVAAVSRLLMLGLALTGLFFRPRISTFLDWATRMAFWIAALAVGIGLTRGVGWWAGFVLGVAAFGSQCVVGYLITARLPREDRIALALGHQNGITAVILALLLEPRVPGTVSVVGPAIVVVNLLHGVANAVRARIRRPPRPVPVPVSSGDRAVEAAA
jgi:NhaP-type Na+/H+ or K+/H+ antiporter